jgi:succinate dehydrogenase / fumarate reductase cytochrome b subunit
MRKKSIVNKKRPMNLDLSSLKFPPMAIVSILHRLSGMGLFILLPVVLFILGKSLHSEESFALMKTMLAEPCYKIVLWIFAAAMIYHILAGIRHMIMDVGFGEHLPAARSSAILTIVLAVIATLFLGVWIW